MATSSIKISPGAVVCNECELIGDITIGTRTVIHPTARIVAEAGPIIIGDNNLIEEQVCIINRAPRVGDGDYVANESRPKVVMVIGASNFFEVGAYSEALKIGDNNILEAKSHVGRQVELSNGCIIGAKCTVTAKEAIPENTVIVGERCERRVQAERPAAQTLQLDFLTKILQNYHLIRKTVKPAAASAN